MVMMRLDSDYTLGLDTFIINQMALYLFSIVIKFRAHLDVISIGGSVRTVPLGRRLDLAI